MKRKYETPFVECVFYGKQDILTVSNGVDLTQKDDWYD